MTFVFARGEEALRGNLSLLDPAKNKVSYNLNTALLAICRELKRQSADIELAGNKLQAILKDIADDAADVGM